MSLFDDLFYSRAVREIFSDGNRLLRMLDFEVALAKAEAECGVVPATAAIAIAAVSKTFTPDIRAIARAAAQAGNPALPLIQQLTVAVKERDTAAARYVHWGATSQDVIDTGTVLQARQAFDWMEVELRSMCAELATFADRHRETIMPGRTWLQHALPITLGWKAAEWLDAMLRHKVRLREVRERALALQFGGAAGTLAAFGNEGRAVLEKLARELGLAQPDIAWHTSRDRVSEIATGLGLITGTLGKIAKDISLLMQTEIAEAFEAAGAGRGTSSTMPQKRNPVLCSVILAAAARVPALVATALSSMVQEHERGLGNWQSEWETLPEIFNLTAGALVRARELVAGLEVDRERMRANLDLTPGLIMAEAVSMALASRVGKNSAHEIVQRACRVAVEEKKHLREILQEDTETGKLIDNAELDRLFDPSAYLGVTQKSIDRVLDRAAAEEEEF
jgi:3-carboxy-cis,cis-muconate cycloisomerase